MFSRGLWNKNANPVTALRRAAMMAGSIDEDLRMIRSLLLAWAVVLAWTAPLATASDEPLAGLDEAIESAREQWHAPGLAVAIVKDDQVVYARGFGTKHLGRNDPPDVQGQDGEQGSELGARDGDVASLVIEHFELAEQPDAHGWTVPLPLTVVSGRSAASQPPPAR